MPILYVIIFIPQKSVKNQIYSPPADESAQGWAGSISTDNRITIWTDENSSGASDNFWEKGKGQGTSCPMMNKGIYWI